MPGAAQGKKEVGYETKRGEEGGGEGRGEEGEGRVSVT